MQRLDDVIQNLRVPCYITCINPGTLGISKTARVGFDKVYKVTKLELEAGYASFLAHLEQPVNETGVVKTSMLDYFRVSYRNEIKKVELQRL